MLVDSIHQTGVLRGRGNAVTGTRVPISGEHGLSRVAKDDARDTTREDATAAKFPSARSTTLGIARATQRADKKIPSNVGAFTETIDGALPEKHTRQLYDQLKWKEANVLAQLSTAMVRLKDYLPAPHQSNSVATVRLQARPRIRRSPSFSHGARPSRLQAGRCPS